MSHLDLIDDLAEKTGKLRSAMYSSDVEAIETAIDSFRVALQRVQATGDWTSDETLKARMESLRPELEQARQLAFLLADMTGQMHDIVSTRARDARQPLYGRTGARYA